MKEPFWIIDQLIEQGITRFCIAPGSRNTPLVIAAAENPRAQNIVHYDERGLGFYALGLAKGSGIPAAIITTSGTAVGNLLPCIMEAFYSHTPLILLTADRPPELRDCGANQTCHQTHIFSRFLNWESDIPPQGSESYFRSIVAQGVFQATQNTPGPIQINCQFREPLYAPSSPLPSGKKIPFPPSRMIGEQVKTQASRGIILIGKIPSSPQPILDLANRLKWPVFADVLSNARNHITSEQILHFDSILNASDTPLPEFVLHFGERLTSKKILELPVSLHVSPFSSLQDPARSLPSRAQSDITSFCVQFEANTDPNWLTLWQEKDRHFQGAIEDFFSSEICLTEAHAIRKIGEILPPKAGVFLANGMPIRDADRFLFPKSTLGFFGNRGLSGIDGNIATAAGIADGINAPLLAVIGDQACLHDLNSLPLLQKTKYPVALVISNNFGGGIFSHLPISNWPHFDTYMAASHNLTFENAAKMFSLPYSLFPDISFERSSLIELVTSREENYRVQKELREVLRGSLCPQNQ